MFYILCFVTALSWSPHSRGFQMNVIPEPSPSDRMDILESLQTNLESTVNDMESKMAALESYLGACEVEIASSRRTGTPATLYSESVEEAATVGDPLLSSQVEAVDLVDEETSNPLTSGDGTTAEPTTTPKVETPEMETTITTLKLESSNKVHCPEPFTHNVDAKICLYLELDKKGNIDTAKSVCLNMDPAARLAVFNTADKWSHVHEEVKKLPSVYEYSLWVGAFRAADGSLERWSDESSIDSAFWNTGEPNNWNGDEGCVAMDSRRGFLMNDENCNGYFYYICEVPI